MAKTKTQAAQAVATVNLALLASVLAATAAGSFVYVSDADAAPMLALTLIAQNPGMTDATGGKATKTTDAAAAYLAANPVTTVSSTTAAAPVAKPTFAIVSNFEMPASGRTGPKRGETYPFGQLEVGQAFFIPATAEKPQPERSYASSVTSARARYSKEVPGETRKNRKGRDVAVVTQERDFQIRAVADGVAFGQPGVKGAAIKRIL